MNARSKGEPLARILVFLALSAFLPGACAINPIPSPGGDGFSEGGAGGGQATVGSDAMPPRTQDGLLPGSPDPDAELVVDGFRAPCGEPLDEEKVSRLVIGLEDTIQLRPGESRGLAVGTRECCVWFDPVPACVAWSVAPIDAGAAIDPETGVLLIDEETPHGATFLVSADVEAGRRVLTIEVFVYTTDANPLVGLWREHAQISCGRDGEDVALPEHGGIGELAFRADGRFGVTWTPFETYQDYWGTYDYDAAAGTLSLAVEGGNYVPPDVDGEGNVALEEDGALALRGLFLGSPADGGSPPGVCGHRFHR